MSSWACWNRSLRSGELPKVVASGIRKRWASGQHRWCFPTEFGELEAIHDTPVKSRRWGSPNASFLPSILALHRKRTRHVLMSVSSRRDGALGVWVSTGTVWRSLGPPKMDSFKMEGLKVFDEIDKMFFFKWGLIDFCSSLEYISSSLRKGNQYGE